MTKRKMSFTCIGCKETFTRPDGLKRSPIYHSTECQFWSKVNKTEGCWEWTGSTHKFGYGEFRSGYTFYRAHRYSYELHHGEIEEGLGINHKCDNPKCVNPDHLYAGTQQQNNADKLARDRITNRSMTKETVLEIKELFDQGFGPTKIAQMFQNRIPVSTIYNIKAKTSWKWLS